jgi:hypothetical protein
MGKIIRPRYPVEFSIGILILVFSLAFLLSFQFFEISWRKILDGSDELSGMFLVAIAATITALVLWEEMLFPVKVKVDAHGAVFRNHRIKLKTQLIIYFLVPVIFGFIYATYDVRMVRFMIFAGVCVLVPVVSKLISGINNYNDFLRLSSDAIEYRNNKEAGVYMVKDVRRIGLVRDDRNVLHKIQLYTSSTLVLIDLDEMELAEFMLSIDEFIKDNYKHLVA